MVLPSSSATLSMASGAKSSIALGIDIGSDKCVVAFVNKSGVVDVLQNDASKRETPVVVHFDKKQRLFGSAGAARANMDPKSTISQLKRLIGRRFNDPSIQKEFSLHSCETSAHNGEVSKGKDPIIEGPNGEVMVNVWYLGRDMEFTAVELMGMFLSYLTRMIKKATDLTISECVIGIPSYFTDQQRRDYLLAAEIAGLKPLRLFHDGAATALDYGLHRNLPHGEATNVVFVDIGHGDTQVTVARFCFGTATVLAHSFDRDLGGRDFDDVIFETFAKKFEQQYRLNVRENPKATFRLRMECEKAKKVLSSNSEALINIECLVGDNDLNGVITRTEFENLSSGLLKRITAACERALVDADLIKNELHSIELVGSGSRIPKISNVLKAFFGRETSRTLNGSECIANGCALQCAMLNRAPEGGIFGVLDRMPFSVVGSPACNNSTTSTNIIGMGSFLLTPRMLTLHPSESVTISYANLKDMPYGVSPCISCYKVASELAGDKYNLEIRALFDIHGIIRVKSASPVKQLELFGSEKAAQNFDSPADKSISRQNSLEMQIEGDSSPEPAVITSGIPAKVQAVTISEIRLGNDIQTTLKEACDREEMLMKQDKATECAKNRRNDLEAYLYRKRDEFAHGLGILASESCKILVAHTLKITGDWLDESGAEEPEEAYVDKMCQLDLVLKKLLEEHEHFGTEIIKKNDFLNLQTTKLHDFELKFKRNLEKGDVDRLNARKLDLMSFVERDGIIPQQDYDKQAGEVDVLLGQIEKRWRDAESQSRPDGTFARFRNNIASFVKGPPSAQPHCDDKDPVHRIHPDPCQKDNSFAEACPDKTQNAPSAVDSDLFAGNQQSDRTLAQAMDDDTPSSVASENISYPDINMTDVTDNGRTSGSSHGYKDALLGGTSSTQPHNPQIDNQSSSGFGKRTQESVSRKIQASMVKVGDYIVVNGRPCKVVASVKSGSRYRIRGTDFLTRAWLDEAFPLTYCCDIVCFTDYRLVDIREAIFRSDSGDELRTRRFSIDLYRKIKDKQSGGFDFLVKVVSWLTEKHIYEEMYVPA